MYHFFSFFERRKKIKCAFVQHVSKPVIRATLRRKNSINVFRAGPRFKHDSNAGFVQTELHRQQGLRKKKPTRTTYHSGFAFQLDKLSIFLLQTLCLCYHTELNYATQQSYKESNYFPIEPLRLLSHLCVANRILFRSVNKRHFSTVLKTRTSTPCLRKELRSQGE